ncbi:MAG: AAA family ATPase [Cyanobacteria bacterium P01_A01_bin.123]
MKPFTITDHVELDAKHRAQCPSCLLEGKTGKNLSVLENGAYKCFRGCTPESIRAALGAEKPQVLPPQTVSRVPVEKVLVSPQKVKEATNRLLTQSTHALRWLTDRGITSEMIEHYRLGVTRSKVGDSSKPSGHTFLPSIAIALPNADGTAYFQKKRVKPWAPDDKQPDGYKRWSQYGIPAMVYTTHKPESPQQTWLCEGEWDAIVLGWAVRHSHVKNDIQVSCFTCGAGNIPPKEELAKLTGDVVSFYDIDAAGRDGAAKLQAQLKQQCRVATVPQLDNAKDGWDVSDAIAADLFDQFDQAAKDSAVYQPPKADNPLRDRLITNDELLARAPEFTDWLVDDVLTSDELFLLAASPRAGKSLLAFTLAQAVATGGKFLGRPVTKGAVIYIRCEDSETKTKEREGKQGWGEGLPVYWLDKFKLSELDHLEQLIDELGARLVVFDTLSRIRDASISESSAEMSQLLEPVQEMCKRQRCTGLLVHHTGKVKMDNAGDIDVFDTIRGSSAIRATCRGTLILAAGENCYRLAVENGWGKLDLQVLLDANTLQWKLVGNWHGPNVDLSQKDRVLNYLNQVGAAGMDDIFAATNLPKRSLYEVLKRLQCDDLVEKRGERQSAVYVRKGIQQIQQLNTVLNSSNEDRENISPSIQQLPKSATSAEKVILNPKSDQNFDHFCQRKIPPTPTDLLNKTPELNDGKGLRIQQRFNSDSTADSTPPPKRVPRFARGDRAEVLSGRFAGKLGVVLGVESTTERRAPLVEFKGDGWAIARFYKPSELKLLKRCPLLADVEIGQNVLGGVLQADSEQGYAIVRFPNGVNTVFNQRMAADLAWGE